MSCATVSLPSANSAHRQSQLTTFISKVEPLCQEINDIGRITLLVVVVVLFLFLQLSVKCIRMALDNDILDIKLFVRVCAVKQLLTRTRVCVCVCVCRYVNNVTYSYY